MLKRVLVPLDGSPLAHRALEFATGFVDANCEIVLLTVVQKPDIPIFGVNPMIVVEVDYADIDAVRKDAQRHLECTAQTLRYRGFNPTVRVEVGDAAYEIVEVACALDVDMIIMSTHGRSGVSRWLFGSVTGQVLGIAPCPVLVVPSRAVQRKPEREAAEMSVG